MDSTSARVRSREITWPEMGMESDSVKARLIHVRERPGKNFEEITVAAANV